MPDRNRSVLLAVGAGVRLLGVLVLVAGLLGLVFPGWRLVGLAGLFGGIALAALAGFIRWPSKSPADGPQPARKLYLQLCLFALVAGGGVLVVRFWPGDAARGAGYLISTVGVLVVVGLMMAMLTALGRVEGEPPPPDVPSAPARLDDSGLGAAVLDAMHLAGSERPDGQDLTTGRVLAALMRVDVARDWERIWLVTGSPERTGLASATDSAFPGLRQPSWRGLPLSPELAASLVVARHIRDRYAHAEVSTGVLALGLLAFPSAGATRALLGDGTVGHGVLLGHVQRDIVGTTLRGLSAIIPAARE